MDYRVADMFDSPEDFEHLASIHSARPRFQNPVQLMKLKMEEGTVFDVDQFAPEDGFEDEEEVYDDDVFSMFNFGTDVKDEKTKVDFFDVERFGHTDFLETEKLMKPLNEEGTVWKMVIRSGGKFTVPDRSKLYIHYSAICEGGSETFDTTMARKFPSVVDLRKETALPGLTLAVTSMSLTEVARFIVYPEMAFGVKGCPPRIAPNAKIMYVIQMLQYTDEAKLNTPAYMTSDERNQLPFETIVEESKKFRSDGNGYYSMQSYSFAIKKWRKAINMLEDYLVTEEEDDAVRRELLWLLYANLAQGYLRLNRPAQACSACKLGLKSTEEGESFSAKLFFRFAKAKLMLKDPDAALGLVNKALKIEPLSEEIRQLRQEILNEQRRENDQLKGMCHAMFRNRKGRSSNGKVKSGKNAVKLACQADPEFQKHSDNLKYVHLEERKCKSDFELDDFVPDLAYCSKDDLKALKVEEPNIIIKTKDIGQLKPVTFF
ncbi:unnamed protein product [Orchesella dallaii]|uniref:peptidylprolyl isomerase n=1 Tax=Orchesella dallaii TaxID=48710 RepID=A0ABP1QFE8_9HEXA